MTFVVLGLGSNRSWNNKSSLELLRNSCRLLEPYFSGFVHSSVYSTKPMYVTDQDDFLNMAVAGFVDEKVVTPSSLLDKIHAIEAELGRNRAAEIRNGPRSIDIDIELWGDEKISFEDEKNPMRNLEIPHPRLKERAFVLIPMLEISGEFADFINGDVFADALSKIGTGGVEKKLGKEDFFNGC